MDRKTKTRNETPLRTLEDDELSLVAGARHCHRRKRHCHGDDHDEHKGDALAGPNPSASPASAPAPTEIVSLIQLFFIGNTGPINVAILNSLGNS